jgi:hypothetical protein
MFTLIVSVGNQSRILPDNYLPKDTSGRRMTPTPGEGGEGMAGKKKLTPEKMAFYRGIIAALGVVHITDNPVLYHEIVDTVDESELIRVAVANEDMEWSGLAANGYRKGKLRNGANASGR